MEFQVKNYNTHDSADKSPPIRELLQANDTHTHTHTHKKKQQKKKH